MQVVGSAALSADMRVSAASLASQPVAVIGYLIRDISPDRAVPGGRWARIYGHAIAGEGGNA